MVINKISVHLNIKDDWCIMQMDYHSSDGEDAYSEPISICKLTPIQMPYVDIAKVKESRKAFTKKRMD